MMTNIMNFIEYHLLPKKRKWIQRGGDPFISPFQYKSQKKTKMKVQKEKKSKKSLKEITKVLDTRGASGITEEKTKKKEELNKLINQNYK